MNKIFKNKKDNIFSNLQEEINVRRKKFSDFFLKNKHFPDNFVRNNFSKELYDKYNDKSSKELLDFKIYVSVAGRIILRRIMGKSSFLKLQDMSGFIQIYFLRDNLNNDFYKNEFKKIDIGDIVGVNGYLFKTKTNELTIFCKKIILLTKSLRPLPDKFHGLENKEKCYRKRYLDIISNSKTKNTFLIRSKIIYCIRNFMVNKGFIEVETPMMHAIPGGANANPFITHHKSLDIDLYLRIAPELYLKRLVVGGFEKIFEINRSFRNEGVSSYHNPEFTMMECYIAYYNYKDLMIFIEKFFRRITKKVLKKTNINYGKFSFDFSKPFLRMTMDESIIKYYPNICFSDLNCFNKVIKIVKNLNIDFKKKDTIGILKNKIFDLIVKKNLIQPTFITKYPIEISPLARRNRKNHLVSDRFELFICGQEIGNGFSELNNPDEQRERFIEQFYLKNDTKVSLKKSIYDEDYIVALEHGLPPTAGFGIGIDRMVMLLTNSHTIKDVIFFPILRPLKR